MSFLERCGTMLPKMMDTLPGYNMTQLPLQVDNSDYTTSLPDVSSVCSERVILTGCPSKNCFRPQDQEMVELGEPQFPNTLTCQLLPWWMMV